MRVRPAAILTFLLGLLLTTTSHADDGLLQDLQRLERLQEAVDVNADSVEYSATERKVVAKGNVQVELEGRSLFADEVSVDLDDQVLIATGHVILMEGLNRLEGERIEYNYRTNLGVVTNGRASFGSGISFSGVEIRREGERTYWVRDGRFTACRLCQPEPQTVDWELRAGETTVYLGEWMVSRDTSFWVRGIPALFSPIAAIPIGPRRTGFLIPRFGYGNRDGFIVKQPFFWAISPSQDLTLIPTYRTKRGFDLPVEYRYLLTEHSGGVVDARYLYDTTPEAPQTNRGWIKWVHNQELSPTWNFKADVQWQTDRFLQRSFVDTPVLLATQRTLPSNVFFTQTTPRYMLLGLLNYTEDLSDVALVKSTSRLPDVRFQWLPSQIPRTPLVAEGAVSAVYLVQSAGGNTGRFDFFPGLELPVALTPWLTGTTMGAFRETAYTQNEQSGGISNRVLAEVGERLTSRFARRFDEPGFGLQRLTHIVEPSLTYLYVPWTDQQSLPQFDSTDFVSPQNRLIYQLTNRLVARWRDASGETRSHEVATLDIAQSWNLQPRTREFSDNYLTGLTPERVDQAVTVLRPVSTTFSQAQERVLSDLVFNATVSPIPGAAFRGTVALNTQHPRADAINAGIELRRPDFLTLEVASTYVRDQAASGLIGHIELHVTKMVILDFLALYDIHSNTFLQSRVGLRYVSCCWEVGLIYDYKNPGPGLKVENSIRVNVELRGATQDTRRPADWLGRVPSGWLQQ